MLLILKKQKRAKINICLVNIVQNSNKFLTILKKKVKTIFKTFKGLNGCLNLRVKIQYQRKLH